MSPTDPRGERLRAFDAHAGAFAAASAQAIERGGPLAAADIAALTGLAGALAAALADWGERVGRLELGRRAPFDAAWAGAVVLESLFDDLLTPGAWRVLAAAYDLARSAA